MRYLALWLLGAIAIFIAATFRTPMGPEFALYLQPLLSLLISGLVLLLALAVGLPIKLPGVSRAWHGTLVGPLIAGLSAVFGWIALTSFFTSTQRYASLGQITLGLCGLFGVDFGVIHWPQSRKSPNQTLEPTAGRRDDQI
jgi:hypothetical protein